MHTEIEITFPKTNWIDDELGRVLIHHDTPPEIGVIFHVFWGEHSSSFIMMTETDEDGFTTFLVMTSDGQQEVCRGWQDGQFQYRFRRYDCERESYASPFIAAAQVIYNVM